MKIVFLDIDGVLNNVPSHRNPATMNRKWWLRTAPECMSALEWLAQECDVRFVISSANRCGRTPEQYRDCFTELGAPSVQVIGETPRLETRPMRGYEIDAWLRAHDYPAPFVILDDDADMEMHLPRLVQTDYQHGFTMHDAARVISLFNE